MADRDAHGIVDAAIALERSHPGVPALEILDLVMEGRHGTSPDFSDPALRWESWAAPANAFGDLLAKAFDRAMTPAEWRGLSDGREGPLFDNALREIWELNVIRPFAVRYRLWGVAGSLPAKPSVGDSMSTEKSRVETGLVTLIHAPSLNRTMVPAAPTAQP